MNDVLLDTDDEERERDREHVPKGTLGKIAKQRFEIMLRQVTFQRGTIARAMAFAIDHADAADEVYMRILLYELYTESNMTHQGYRYSDQVTYYTRDSNYTQAGKIIPSI